MYGRFNVVAPDLAGCGDSDHKDVYSMNSHAEDLEMICMQEGFARPFLVGHSMGASVVGIWRGRGGMSLKFTLFASGSQVCRAARIFGDKLAGVIVLDGKHAGSHGGIFSVC